LLLHQGNRKLHRREFSYNIFRNQESLKSVPDKDEFDTVNSSMIQIVPDYMDQREQENSLKSKMLGGNDYYLPKAMILISKLPIFDTMKEMLLTLYKQAIYRINYPIDAYIYYLTYEAPLPSLGTIVKLSLPNMKNIEVSDFEYNMEYLASYFENPLLSFPNFYQVLYWFL
jgi:hypothetical protein